MMLYKWKSSAVLYSLSLFEDLKLKLKFKSEFKSELLLLLISDVIRAGTYQTSVNHKGDT